MKTKFLSALLPLLVVGFATTAAMNTNDLSQKKTLANEVGFIHLTNPERCNASSECSPTGSQMCTVGDVAGATRLWKKNQNGQCVVELYRPIPE